MDAFQKQLKVIHSASLRPQDWLRFVQIDPFPGQWNRLKLNDDALRALEICIMTAPEAGTLIPGAGGLRKVRFSVPGEGKGKRGSYRTFYVYLQEYGTVILWAIIDKGENADLSKSQCNAIAQQITRLKRLLDQGVIR